MCKIILCLSDAECSTKLFSIIQMQNVQEGVQRLLDPDKAPPDPLRRKALPVQAVSPPLQPVREPQPPHARPLPNLLNVAHVLAVFQFYQLLCTLSTGSSIFIRFPIKRNEQIINERMNFISSIFVLLIRFSFVFPYSNCD